MQNKLLVFKLRKEIPMSHFISMKKENLYSYMKFTMDEAADYIEKLEAIVNMESSNV